MKKFILGFSFCFVALTLSTLTYVGRTLYVAKPGFYVSTKAIQLSTEQKSKVVTALIKLSDLSNLAGQEHYSALFLGSAGVLGINSGISAIESKYLLSKSVTFAKIYSDRTGNINPFMETRFTLALHLNDNGEKKQAKEIVSKTIAFAQIHDPQNYWIENFEKLSRKL